MDTSKTIKPLPKNIPFAWIGIFWLLYFLRFGYDFATSDQDEMLPYLYRLLDPNLFGSDWFVRSLTESFNVRTYFVYSLYLPSLVLPIPLVVAIAYLVCWTVIIQAVYRIALSIIREPLAALMATFLTIVGFHKTTLGANDVVYNLLVPELVSWTFVLPAVLAFWNKKMQNAALLLGIGTCFHLITGMTTGIVLAILTVWQVREQALSRRSGFLFLGFYALSSLPIVGPIAFQQLTSKPAITLANLFGTGSPFEILVFFRLPLHHLFGYNLTRTLGWLALVILGAAAFYFLQKGGVLRHQTFLKRFSFVSGLLMGLAFFGVEVFQSLAVAKFQFYKLAVWLKLFAVVLISGATIRFLKYRLSSIIDKINTYAFHKTLWWQTFLVLLFLGFAVGVWQKNDRLFEKAGPFCYAASSLSEMEQWIYKNTPQNALFAIPPSNTTFRSNAKRSIIVNWLSFPFRDPEMVFWRHQLQQVAPLVKQPIPMRQVGATLDAAFHEHAQPNNLQPEWRWAKVIPQKPDYILRNKNLEKRAYRLAIAHQNQEWVLYKWPKL